MKHSQSHRIGGKNGSNSDDGSVLNSEKDDESSSDEVDNTKSNIRRLIGKWYHHS